MGTRHTKQPDMYSCFATDLSVFAMFDHHEVTQRRNLIGPFFSRRAILKLEQTVQGKVSSIFSITYDFSLSFDGRSISWFLDCLNTMIPRNRPTWISHSVLQVSKSSLLTALGDLLTPLITKISKMIFSLPSIKHFL